MLDQKTIDKRNAWVKRLRTDAMFFYFIAALTLINSIMIYADIMGAEVLLPVGMLITRTVDRAALAGTMPIALSIAIDVAVVAVFVIIGYLSGRKQNIWAYTIGMVLFAADIVFDATPVTEAIWDWLFAAYVLIMLSSGRKSLVKLLALDKEILASGNEIPPYVKPVEEGVRLGGLLRPKQKAAHEQVLENNQYEKTVFSMQGNEEKADAPVQENTEAAE